MGVGAGLSDALKPGMRASSVAIGEIHVGCPGPCSTNCGGTTLNTTSYICLETPNTTRVSASEEGGCSPHERALGWREKDLVSHHSCGMHAGSLQFWHL